MAVKLFGMLPNFFVVPLAVTETDGCAELNINSYADASSLLPLDEQGVRNWVGAQDLRTVDKVTVGTIRLDTFLNLAEIQTVDYLKIDAQGMDLEVVRSAGNRLKDIHRICLECDVSHSSSLSRRLDQERDDRISRESWIRADRCPGAE